MPRHGLLAITTIGVLLTFFSSTAAGAQRARERLNAYNAIVSPADLRSIAQQGFDVADQRQTRRGLRVDLVLTAAQRDKLARQGVDATLTRVRGGMTVRQFAARQAAGGFNVWRSWDERGGFRDRIHRIARRNRGLIKLVRLGTTLQGRELLALKVTRRARRVRDGRRPAVLYSSLQHAREWISPEVNWRLLRSYVRRWRNGDREVRRLLRRNELWFVLVANPDGYQYTFEVERLWRKNLRENDGDGETTIADGVDPNRNWPNHWGYDEEGSSSIFSSETYRGPSPVSERETQALKGLLDRVDFEFHVNWHSAGQWLLYPEGWQTSTPTADDPIYFALSGNLDRPAIPDFHPGLSSDVLYVTNGETTDYAHAGTGALAWTPELSEGCDGCGFVFPDDDALVQEEFERNLPFARSVANSADNPANPDSSLGIRTKPFYVKSDDPYKEGLPGANFTFEHSYGDPQPVAVIAKRSVRRVRLKYRINGGRVRTRSTFEWQGGERYDPADVYYHQLRSNVRGTDPGDSVRVWFEGRLRGRRVRSQAFTYRAVSETGNRVLVMAAEDYTGASPEPSGGPKYVNFYVDAVEANGQGADVYDVDARGRRAPDQLGVLSHYDAVIWYTGDDAITRKAGWGPGNADRLAYDETLEVRAFMNEGGRLLYTGKNSGLQWSPVAGLQLYDPKGEGPCDPNPAYDPRRCLVLQGTGGDGMNDVIEYWLGAYVFAPDDGTREEGGLFEVDGIDEPFGGMRWAFNGPESANNQDASGSFVSTSGILPPDRFPQFRSWPSTRWDKVGGPYDPHTGNRYVYSQISDVAYKRLTREIAVPAGGGSLTFWTSYDTEPAWDHLFVEARTPGGDDWTTLPEANGHTTTAPGDSCAAGWTELHPQLAHYVTWDGTATCTSTGSSGAWHAASGNSGGWQQWRIDLSAYRGRTVEISIAYATDWAIQNLGVFLDDVTLPDGTSTSFESGFEGWTVSGAPEGSGANANDWQVTDAGGFPVGDSITTPDSIMMGFGFEGISTRARRNEVMGRVLGHLLE